MYEGVLEYSSTGRRLGGPCRGPAPPRPRGTFRGLSPFHSAYIVVAIPAENLAVEAVVWGLQRECRCVIPYIRSFSLLSFQQTRVHL